MSREIAFCRWCQARFLYDPKPDAEPLRCCGRPACWAREHWTDEQWAGRARMARARQVAGRRLVRVGLDDDSTYQQKLGWTTDGILDDLDREALSRVGSASPDR